MKYEKLEDFMQAKEKGEFTGVIIVDNEFVVAYDSDDNCVYDFGEAGPESVLIAILSRLGFKVEVP